MAPAGQFSSSPFQTFRFCMQCIIMSVLTMTDALRLLELFHPFFGGPLFEETPIPEIAPLNVNPSGLREVLVHTQSGVGTRPGPSLSWTLYSGERGQVHSLKEMLIKLRCHASILNPAALWGNWLRSRCKFPCVENEFICTGWKLLARLQ